MDGPIGSGGCYVHVFGMRLIFLFIHIYNYIFQYMLIEMD